ncbi:MAG: hypothetical protein A3G27_09095 [Betaproteobacteria bacterium RIFCSPLOWO2_12_FULL_66_14]|nr:MAG: hypothetical protein A3G27_09095 [Betaproteobacteria bacterium RIFCSPLOWO2_12_FULL_66_14]
MAFNLPSVGNKASKPSTPGARAAPSGTPAPLPLIGRLPLAKQLQLLVSLLALTAVLAAAVVFLDYRAASNGTVFVQVSGEMRMLSQRIGKATQAASFGNEEAFRQLADARQRFVQSLGLLTQGGEADGVVVPPSSDAIMPMVETLQREWEKTDRDIQLVLAQQKNLVGLAGAVPSTGTANPTLAELAAQMLNAKNAGRRVVDGSEALLGGTQKLVSAYRDELAGRSANFAAMGVLALLGVALVWLMVRAYADEQTRQAAGAQRQNRSTQEAIQQLMDDMQRVAEGDLLVKAAVTEDVTGAIADSVNFTVEELRKLVGHINEAAGHLTTASEAARDTSTQLLGAAEYQTREIGETNAAMLGMAEAMNEMSASTAQSAGVARTSVAAAQKGRAAVENAIAGMNDIRGQMQETSKRIKRLGESSQEIGEIVELISDITDQTNVLALNAAIQAASAGEAGRGFTVVAEEVQRLAERSAQATKQIAAIVKAIQADTLQTVAAMEKSTQGVVEGTKLSNAAGQALADIGEVSQTLAQLIESVSAATQKQAAGATSMASNMQDILRITQQTAQGTQRTAASLDQLAQLAQGLKSSVARFRMQ